MDIIWKHGELGGPTWEARVEALSNNGIWDFFYLNAWPLGLEWAWEVVYWESDFATPQVMASGVMPDVAHAKTAAVVGFAGVLRDADDVWTFKQDEKPLDRCR